VIAPELLTLTVTATAPAFGPLLKRELLAEQVAVKSSVPSGFRWTVANVPRLHLLGRDGRLVRGVVDEVDRPLEPLDAVEQDLRAGGPGVGDVGVVDLPVEVEVGDLRSRSSRSGTCLCSRG
jgi:hypothetical protein